jgi:hypothetical protein
LESGLPLIGDENTSFIKILNCEFKNIKIVRSEEEEIFLGKKKDLNEIIWNGETVIENTLFESVEEALSGGILWGKQGKELRMKNTKFTRLGASSNRIEQSTPATIEDTYFIDITSNVEKGGAINVACNGVYNVKSCRFVMCSVYKQNEPV